MSWMPSCQLPVSKSLKNLSASAKTQENAKRTLYRLKTPIKSCPRRGSAGHAPLAEGTLPSSRADLHSLIVTGFLKGLCNYIRMIQYLGSPEKRIGFCTIRRHVQASGFARCTGLCIHNTDPGSLSPPAAASTSSAPPQLLARAALKGSKSLGMRRRASGSTNGNEGSKVQRSSELTVLSVKGEFQS